MGIEDRFQDEQPCGEAGYGDWISRSRSVELEAGRDLLGIQSVLAGVLVDEADVQREVIVPGSAETVASVKHDGATERELSTETAGRDR
jgi:hypothetical protein